MWDVESAQEVAALPAPKGLIRTIRFSETGRYLAAIGGQERIRIWDMENMTFKDFNMPPDLKVYDVFGGQDSDFLLAARKADKLILTRLSDLQAEQSPMTGIRPMDIIRFSENGRFLLHRNQADSVTVWAIPTMKKVGQFKGHPGRSHAFGINFAGTRFTIQDPDGALHTYDLESQTRTGTVSAPPDAIGYLALSPDGSYVADTGSNYIRLSRADLPPPPRQRIKAASSGYSLAMNGTGTRSCGYKCRQATRVGCPKRKKAPSFPTQDGGKIDAVDFSPDGEFLSWLNHSGELLVWSLKKNQMVDVIQGIKGEPRGLRFDASNRLIVALTTMGLWVYKAESRTLLVNKRWAQRDEVTLDLSRDGNRAIIGTGSPDSSSGRIEIWEVSGAKKVQNLAKTSSLVSGVAYDPRIMGRGSTFAGVLTVWDVALLRKKSWTI